MVKFAGNRRRFSISAKREQTETEQNADQEHKYVRFRRPRHPQRLKGWFWIIFSAVCATLLWLLSQIAINLTKR